MVMVGALLAALGLLSLASAEYENAPGDPIDFDCPGGEALVQVSSSRTAIAGTSALDRQWEFSCEPIESKAKEFCYEDEDINSFGEKLLSFQCPPNSYIAGLDSTYDSATQDREWSIKCCRTLGICTRECRLTNPLNFVETNVMFINPSIVITGIYGVYDGTSGDRVYYLEICETAQCGPTKLLKYIFPWVKK